MGKLTTTLAGIIGGGLAVFGLSLCIAPGIGDVLLGTRNEQRYNDMIDNEYVSFSPGLRYGILTVIKTNGEKVVYQSHGPQDTAQLHRFKIMSKTETNIYNPNTVLGKVVFETAERKHKEYMLSIILSNRAKAFQQLR